jgi:3-hydroxyisobutyrate dehydrogenase-like beta-hydroxyacid dehydrogenase
MSSIRKVGILGLGKMGTPMAKHLLAGGFAVAGYDPVDAARATAAAQEADLARLSLPLCGAVKETIKGLKIRMGLGLRQGFE